MWALCGQSSTETGFSPIRSVPLPLLFHIWDTQWRSWLRHCATSWKVAGSIPDGVTAIFQLLNLSDHIVAMGSTQPLTEMSTRNPSWG
jgi:hypothetical protein